MNDPFLGFERPIDSDEVNPVLACGFDWEELDRVLEERQPSASREIANAAAADVITKLVQICGDGVSRIKRKDRKASRIGVTFICACAILRRGQIDNESITAMADAIGVSRQYMWRAMVAVRKKMN